MDRHIGDRLRRCREGLRVGLTDLADRLGIGAPTLERYESGAEMMPAALLFEAARILGCPFQAFFEGLRPARRADAAPPPRPAGQPPAPEL
ncbi:MAG TPA: helix-turn-helix transcriptional regulator [Alphaproteobacteria bacterium]|nr:helix-turn-helix transcriptional regulator [Alphaproteobacteria bacterium]